MHGHVLEVVKSRLELVNNIINRVGSINGRRITIRVSYARNDRIIQDHSSLISLFSIFSPFCFIMLSQAILQVISTLASCLFQVAVVSLLFFLCEFLQVLYDNELMWVFFWIVQLGPWATCDGLQAR
jgi:hypothetical protein